MRVTFARSEPNVMFEQAKQYAQLVARDAVVEILVPNNIEIPVTSGMILDWPRYVPGAKVPEAVAVYGHCNE